MSIIYQSSIPQSWCDTFSCSLSLSTSTSSRTLRPFSPRGKCWTWISVTILSLIAISAVARRCIDGTVSGIDTFSDFSLRAPTTGHTAFCPLCPFSPSWTGLFIARSDFFQGLETRIVIGTRSGELANANSSLSTTSAGLGTSSPV